MLECFERSRQFRGFFVCSKNLKEKIKKFVSGSTFRKLSNMLHKLGEKYKILLIGFGISLFYYSNNKKSKELSKYNAFVKKLT